MSCGNPGWLQQVAMQSCRGGVTLRCCLLLTQLANPCSYPACLLTGKCEVCHQPPGRGGEVGPLPAPQRHPQPGEHAGGGGGHCGRHHPQVVMPLDSMQM